MVMHERLPNEKAEPPPPRNLNCDSGTDSANSGWLWHTKHHLGSFAFSFS
jgi:hypothetical protein